MNKVAKEIECLKRLSDMTSQIDDIILFLKGEGIIDDNTIRAMKQSPDHPKELQRILKELKAAGKFQLLEYTWNLLPVENIRIYIITDRNQKEFVFHG